MAKDFFKIYNALFKCEKLEDFLNNPEFSIDEYAEEIIQHIDFFNQDLLQPLVQELITTGKSHIIEENISLFNMSKSLKILEDFPEEYKEDFEKIFLDNFDKILVASNSLNINDIRRLSSNPTTKEALSQNMDQAIKLMGAFEKEEFIDILLEATKDTQMIEEHLESFLLSDKRVATNTILGKLTSMEGISDDKIYDIICSDPKKVLSSCLYGYPFKDLLSKIETIFNEANLPEDKINNARMQTEEYLEENFYDIMNSYMVKYEEFGETSYSIDMLESILSFNTDRNLLTNKFVEEYPNLQEHVYRADVIRLENLTKGLEQVDSIKDTDILVEKMYGNTKDENTKFVISKMIREVLDNQNLSIADMKVCGEGAYSSSIKIGDYVMKVGTPRQTNEYANSSRIVAPLVRRELPFDYENPDKYANLTDTEKTFIEVQNAVDAEWYKDLTDEEIEQELYMIYAELRDDGIVWKDVKKENVGRLLKPNTVDYTISGRQLEVDDKAVGITKNAENMRTLQAGELVVIDTDFLYDEEQVKSELTSGAIASLHKKFEAIYQQQKSVRDIIELLKSADNEVTRQDRETGMNALKSLSRTKEEKGMEQEYYE